jgi:hypothetical protein
MPTPVQFDPGFRLSRLDGLILLAGAALSAGGAVIDAAFGAAIAFTVGHFFLFCNIVRMHRARELIWTGAFIALAAGSALFSVPGWPQTFGLMLLLTLALVALEMRSPAYHGVFWKKINPALETWWRARQKPLS